MAWQVCVYKLCGSVLYNKLKKCAKENNLFIDEQHGIKQKRSCIDRLHVLRSIIRNRKA